MPVNSVLFTRMLHSYPPAAIDKNQKTRSHPAAMSYGMYFDKQRKEVIRTMRGDLPKLRGSKEVVMLIHVV